MTESESAVAPGRSDPSRLKELAALVNQACDGAAHDFDVSLRLKELAPQLDATAHQALEWAFVYQIAVTRGGSRPSAELSPLDGDNSIYPPALKIVDVGTQSLWRDLAPAVKHPLAVARLSDIAFTLNLGPGNRRVAAEAAAKAYMSCDGSALRASQQANGLTRAWTVVRSVGLDSLEPDVVHVMLDLAQREMTTPEDQPYRTRPA